MQFVNKVPVLIIAGGWNFNIFTPDWIGKYIVPGDTLTVLYPVNNANASPKITSDKVEILVAENKLQIEPLTKDDENFNLVQDLAMKLVDYLPHTPVTAYGINFTFQEDITEEFEKIFLLNDSEKWKDEIVDVESFACRREFRLKNGNKLNFTVRTNEGKIMFDFNFHFDITDLVEFKSLVSDNSVLELKNSAIEMMNVLYGLTID